MHTPCGPATLNVAPETSPGAGVHARAWGPGADWVIDRMPAWLGAHDDPTGFVPQHDSLRATHRRYRDWRMPRTGLVVDALVPAIIEQRVTGKQAFGAYRRLVRRFGSQAPGPGEPGLMVPPTAKGWLAIPSWEWLQAGVDASRADTIVRALRVAHRLEECADLPLPEAHSRLRSIPGVGVWTAAEVAQRALGDADAVSFGDYHVAKDVGWALVGRPVDDAGLARLLEPYAGHRYRVQFLVQAGRLGRPRRGPRLTVPTHLPTRR